jgi:outer membrane lipoprotein SlyB
MEAAKRTLHPLLVAAAVSVIVFSGVGVAAITGLIPTSKGSVKEETPVAVAPAPAAAPEPVSPSEPAPAPKPVKKHVVAKTHKPAQVAYAETPALTPPPPPVMAQAPQTVEAPKPVMKPGLLGTVEAVREVTVDGSGNGVGAVAGGAVGGVLGHQLAHDSKLVTLVGAAAGAFIGNEAQKRQNATKHWEMTVRLDDGTTQTLKSNAQPVWHQGDRVRLLNGELQPV